MGTGTEKYANLPRRLRLLRLLLTVLTVVLAPIAAVCGAIGAFAVGFYVLALAAGVVLIPISLLQIMFGAHPIL